MAPYAKVIKDSLSPAQIRLTTMEICCHRFVLSEFNTHRKFSRNSASSRAIPFLKQLGKVQSDPAIPLVWAAEQRGMQGGEEILRTQDAQDRWLAARDAAAYWAEELAALGVHKSIVNRLLEPFMWHIIVVSATDWENFFNQRCSPLAQPEIRAVADLMRAALDASIPEQLFHGQYHLPYMEGEDMYACERSGEDPRYVSSARCGRVSYLTHDGQRDVQLDGDLFRKLTEARPMHASPLEHVAKPEREIGEARGNFRGWVQLRQEVEAREGIDSRR